jgi:hypothetical protein
MRRTAFLLAALTVSAAGCARGDKAADTTVADTTASAAAAPNAAAPVARPLTAADIAGEWAGTSYADGADTVVSRWHIRSKTDSTAVLTFDGTKQTVDYTTRFAGDSLISVSEPYTPPGAPAGTPKMTFHVVGRLDGDTLRGVTHVMSAAKPDSMITTHHWKATRAK